MSPSQDYFYLSKISTSTLYKGEIRIPLPFHWPESLAAPLLIYLYQHHTYVPYQVKTWHIKDYTAFISLIHFSLLTQEKAHNKGYDLFLAWPWLHQELKKSFSFEYLPFCRKFKVIDHKSNNIGFLSHLQKRKIQPLLVIDQGEKTMEIPVHEKFIHHIDLDNHSLTVQWPPSQHHT